MARPTEVANAAFSLGWLIVLALVPVKLSLLAMRMALELQGLFHASLFESNMGVPK